MARPYTYYRVSRPRTCHSLFQIFVQQLCQAGAGERDSIRSHGFRRFGVGWRDRAGPCGGADQRHVYRLNTS